MQITGFERTVVCVPFFPGILPPPDFEEAMPGYPAPLDQRRQDILQLHTDSGQVGLGMSGPYFGRSDDAPPAWSGRDPLSFEPRAVAGGGWSMALLDLIGKALDLPLYRIFGGRAQEKILVDYWISRMGPEASAQAARRAREQGFHGIKIKCKYEDHNVVDRVLAMHEAAPELRIVVDPNERFQTVEQTLELARPLEGLDVVFEDPMPKTNLEDYRRIRGETSVLVAAHLQTPRQVIEVVERQAVDGINVAPSDWAFIDMARIAEAGGLPVWQASNVDLGLFDVFRLHAGAAAANCIWGSDQCGNFVHQHSLLRQALVQDGYARVPQDPGLGVELDEEAIARYTVED